MKAAQRLNDHTIFQRDLAASPTNIIVETPPAIMGSSRYNVGELKYAKPYSPQFSIAI